MCIHKVCDWGTCVYKVVCHCGWWSSHCCFLSVFWARSAYCFREPSVTLNWRCSFIKSSRAVTVQQKWVNLCSQNLQNLISPAASISSLSPEEGLAWTRSISVAQTSNKIMCVDSGSWQSSFGAKQQGHLTDWHAHHYLVVYYWLMYVHVAH